MPRAYVRKVGGRPYQNYDVESLDKAVNAVLKTNISIRQAAEQFQVPKSTISDYLKAHKSNKIIKKPGTPTALNTDQEEKLVQGLLICSEWGFPLKCRDIQLVVKSFLDRLGKSHRTCFVNNIPGKDWINSFLRRHQHLTLRFGENIKRVRAGVTKTTLQLYFNNINDILKDVPPTNIFNYDETNFVDDPGKKLVVVRKGTKHPEVVRDTSKTSVSVMFCVSADGKLLPPYTVYKAKHLYPTWVDGGLEGAGYNRNDSGWFDMPIFEDWFISCYLPAIRHLDEPKAQNK